MTATTPPLTYAELAVVYAAVVDSANEYRLREEDQLAKALYYPADLVEGLVARARFWAKLSEALDAVAPKIRALAGAVMAS